MFKVYFGPKKVIVLAGYKTVKQALVNFAEEFGERELNQTFKFAEDHGKQCLQYIYIIFRQMTLHVMSHLITVELKLQICISHLKIIW